MDFAMLPPEVNSSRMYAGAGSGPLLAAAASWDALAVELQSMGMAYETAIAELHNGWSGPSASAMAAAAAPYAAWMRTTSAQAEQTASHAKAAAAAYETAFAMTVPPPVVMANRARLAALLATNLLGQNTSAIAATETQYGEMWAQDTAAMYRYAAGAAAASQLTSFTEPPQTTNPAGTAAQAGATGQVAGGTVATAAGHAGTITSTLANTLQGLASPVAAAAPAVSTASTVATVLPSTAAIEPTLALTIAGLATDLFGTFVIDSAGTFGFDVAGTFGIDLIGVGEINEELPELLPLEELTSAPATGVLGEAATLGELSVPQAWTMAAPPIIQQVGAPLPAVAAAAPVVAAGETAFPLGEMATAALAGRATAAAGRGRGGRAGITNRRRPAMSQQPGESGKPEKPAKPGKPQQPVRQAEQPENVQQPVRPANGPITSIAGELRELAELRDAGILTEEEFTEQKRRLLAR